MKEKFFELHKKMTELGVPVWFIRDPVKNQPSVSLTMLLISFTFYIFTMINKLGQWFSDVDGAAQLLLICSGLYFGRSFSGGKGSAKLKNEKDE